MKSLLLILAAILTFAPMSASALVCADPATKTAEELKKDIEALDLVTFDTKFCEAMSACVNKESEDNKIAAMKAAEEVKKKIPATILVLKKHLADIEVEQKILEKEKPINLKKITSNIIWETSLENSLAFLEEGLVSTSPYPPSLAVPTYASAEQQYLSLESEFKSLPSQIAEYEKKLLDPAKSASVTDYYKEWIKQQKTSYALYDAHLKNPDKTPFPLPKYLTEKYVPKKKVENTLESTEAAKTVVEKKIPDCNDAKYKYKQVVKRLSYKKSGSCNLSPEEIVAVEFYTQSGYTCMNKYLRKVGEKDERIDPLIKYLNSGLAKLPKYRGIVNRGASLPQNIRDEHIKGQLITYPAYTSTSTSSGFHGSDKFTIISKAGRPVMTFSTHSDEYEVLFAPGTVFKVLDKQASGESYSYVMLEVDDQKTLTEAEEAALVAQAKEKKEPVLKTWQCPIDDGKAVIPKTIP